MEIQEWRGIRNAVIAEVITDTEEIFETGTPVELMPVATLTKTTANSTETHYYNNVAGVVIESVGADTVTIAGAAIPFDKLALSTGQHYDATKGMFVEGERESKYYALGYITEKTDGTEVFVWRQKGKFSIPDSTHATKTDGTEANGQEIVYTGINTNHKYSLDGKLRTIKAVNVDTKVNTTVKEAEFFATVQTPDTVDAVTA